MGLYTLIVDSYIPQEYQELIQHHALWDEETQEWHLVIFNSYKHDPISLTWTMGTIFEYWIQYLNIGHNFYIHSVNIGPYM